MGVDVSSDRGLLLEESHCEDSRGLWPRVTNTRRVFAHQPNMWVCSVYTFRLPSLAFEDAFSSEPTRVLVVDLQEQKAIAPSKVAIKHSTNRYVVMTITMSQQAEQLRVRFGSGAMHKLIVREYLGKIVYVAQIQEGRPLWLLEGPPHDFSIFCIILPWPINFAVNTPEFNQNTT